jgi:hypothetical protein
MNENEHKGFDFERFKAEAIKGMYAGRPLNGEKGVFAPLLKHFLESALEGEPAGRKGSRGTLTACLERPISLDYP